MNIESWTRVSSALPDLARASARVLLTAAVVASLNACSSIGFYTQAVAGQFELWRTARPIDELLESDQVDATTRDKLKLVAQARDFAHATLKLPDNGSYRDYVELNRDYVVWNVFVAPVLSLEAIESCFLFAGCLSYRGYFDRKDAEQFAEQWRRRGMDVYVGGVAAYSTLGWFDDPVLSSMLQWDNNHLVEILFHELTHQQLYVADDTTFNESFAVAIARAGLEDFLASRGQSSSLVQHAQARQDELTRLILWTRSELEALYQSDAGDSEKLTRKQAAFAAMMDNYQALKKRWGNDPRFDAWMSQAWNNARLLSVATYNDLVPAFRALLASHQGDYASTYAAVARIAELEPAARLRCLRSIAENTAADACPPRSDAAIDGAG